MKSGRRIYRRVRRGGQRKKEERWKANGKRQSARLIRKRQHRGHRDTEGTENEGMNDGRHNLGT